MKKIIGVCVAAVLAANVYAFDDNFELKTVGSVAEYTKIDYTITEKFGDYYRSPKAKYVHVFDASGKQIESDELTSKDSLVDKILYNYDSEGRVTSTVCTDGDGKIQWKSIFTYDGDGNKIDESQYNANDDLVNRSIFKYIEGKQIEEAFYNSDGALLGKFITKLDEKGRNVELAQYNEDGQLELKQVYTYNDAGKLSEVAYSDMFGRTLRKTVYRFDASYSVTEEQTYNAQNKLAVRIIFKYDTYGNVTKATTYNVAEKFGTTVNELAGIVEYTYKYGAGAAKTE
ncbi:MAG: hypothetical protein II921_01240 [Treponema sp.]|nr:hypothetical protein [Treponema sp.]